MNQLLLGMAMQAFISFTLSSCGLIELKPGQQLIAGLMLMLFALLSR